MTEQVVDVATLRPRLLTLQAAAKYSGLSDDTLREHIKMGSIRSAVIKLEGAKTGRRLIELKSLDAFIDRFFGGNDAAPEKDPQPAGTD